MTRSAAAPARVVLLLLALSVLACSREAPPRREGPPKRVVSLAPSCTETLIDLGLADRLVGVSDYCPELPAGCKAARVGGLVNPNVESILALSPDLVLTVQNAEDRTLAALRRRGIDVRAEDPQSLAEVLRGIGELAELLGAPERGRELLGSLRERLDRVTATTAATATTNEKPRVYVEVDWPPCFSIGRRTFVHDALLAAGGQNLFGDVDKGYFQTSKEEIVARGPDRVLILHPVDRPLSERAELADLLAKPGVVIADFERDLLLRSSPRLVTGIEKLAERLRER
jgi:iron complex transport system substrate-binding protein